MNREVLFISIDGMTDPLGQAQVMPYLIGLASKKYQIHIISCEKKLNFGKNKETILNTITKNNMAWSYCFYQTKIPIISQIHNFLQLKKLSNTYVKNKETQILIHCRSYLPALIGLTLKRKYKSFFIFDMRGFWADERIDGNIWDLKKPVQSFLYRYFKKKVLELLENADRVVTLTKSAKKEIESWNLEVKPDIFVIPCCADTQHFVIQPDHVKSQTRKQLGIPEDANVIGYLGSLGTWYMLNEMLDFFSVLLTKKPSSVFFLITNDSPDMILKNAKQRQISETAIVIKSASRQQVPTYVSVLDFGIFFIKPLYSKKGSSPTKLAELLSCGIPIITNKGVGDVDELIVQNQCGVLIESFDQNAYIKAIEETSLLLHPKTYYRSIAQNHFSLEKGMSEYLKVYESGFHHFMSN